MAETRKRTSMSVPEMGRMLGLCRKRRSSMAEKENESNRLFEDEKVIEIEIERLRSFKDHPFKVTDDKEMHLLKDSIKQYGVLNPLIVRPVPDGVYEIISGHRRKYAAQQLGYRKVPVIIRVMNDEEAIIKMVDANLQRYITLTNLIRKSS